MDCVCCHAKSRCSKSVGLFTRCVVVLAVFSQTWWSFGLSISVNVSGVFEELSLPSASLADGLTVLGTGDGSIWNTRSSVGIVNITAGEVNITNLTILDAALGEASSAASFLVPRVLSLGPSVNITLRNVRMTTSCDQLLQQQQHACGLLPWAAIRITAGWLHVAGWRSGRTRLRNVTLTCGSSGGGGGNLSSPSSSPAGGGTGGGSDQLPPPSPSPSPPPSPAGVAPPTPPCIALAAGSAPELAAALASLADSGTDAAAPPAYITLTANISLTAAAGWPTGPPWPAVTRNVTLAGTPPTASLMRDPQYLVNEGALNGTGSVSQSAAGGADGASTLCCPGDVGIAAATPPVAAGWVWPRVVSVDLAGGVDLLYINKTGTLTVTGLVLENLAVGVPGGSFPMSLVGAQSWAFHVEPPGHLVYVDVLLSFTADEFGYWLYWLTLAASPAADVASQSSWLESFFPRSLQGTQVTAADAIHWPSCDSPRVRFRRTSNVGVPVVFPRRVERSGLGFVLPDTRVPLTHLAGASNCRELAAALGATGDSWKPVIVLTADISLGVTRGSAAAAGSNNSNTTTIATSNTTSSTATSTGSSSSSISNNTSSNTS
ncbi:hypothetical protein Agub_g11399, partial [Astrephomene gubernaculifera]